MHNISDPLQLSQRQTNLKMHLFTKNLFLLNDLVTYFARTHCFPKSDENINNFAVLLYVLPISVTAQISIFFGLRVASQKELLSFLSQVCH